MWVPMVNYIKLLFEFWSHTTQWEWGPPPPLTHANSLCSPPHPADLSSGTTWLPGPSPLFPGPLRLQPPSPLCCPSNRSSIIQTWTFVPAVPSASDVPWPSAYCKHILSHSLSRVWLCDPMDYSMPGFPILHYLPQFPQTQVHLSRWCHPTISSSVVPFSHLQSFPTSGSFPMSQFFASGGQSTGASASVSVLPMNI